MSNYTEFNVQPHATSTQGIYEANSTQKMVLGARLEMSDGRVFRYAKNGGTALAAGYLCQSPAVGGNTTAQVNLTVVTAGAAGGDTIVVTTTTDTITVNLWQGGYLTVYGASGTTGTGQTYRIKSNTACSANGNSTITIYDTFVVAVSTSCTVSVCKHPYDSVVVGAATMTGIVTGVPLIAVTAAYYCWLQTWGVCGVWSDSAAALTVAADVLASNAVAGSVEADDAAKAQQFIGKTIYAGAASKCIPVFLQIAP